MAAAEPPTAANGGPRVRADLADVHDADPGHRPGQVWEAEDMANGRLAAVEAALTASDMMRFTVHVGAG